MPGPARPLLVGGEEVRGILPAFPNVIPQALCVSYAGKMWMSIALDETVVTEPQRVVTLYLEELRALAVRHGVDPDDESEPPPRPQPQQRPAPTAAGVAALV